MSRTDQIRRYYHYHARIYDITRWTFLFGRSAMMKEIALHITPGNILEVGCGTGSNLVRLSRTFPNASITGVDISEAMLKIAHRKLQGRFTNVRLLHAVYDQPLKPDPPFDLILFSYVLSMMNPGWQTAIVSAQKDLVGGGYVAAVDFHRCSRLAIKRWMAFNHVRLDGHLLNELQGCFESRRIDIRHAYRSLWTFFAFLGAKVP